MRRVSTSQRVREHKERSLEDTERGGHECAVGDAVRSQQRRPRDQDGGSVYQCHRERGENSSGELLSRNATLLHRVNGESKERERHDADPPYGYRREGRRDRRTHAEQDDHRRGVRDAHAAHS